MVSLGTHSVIERAELVTPRLKVRALNFYPDIRLLRSTWRGLETESRLGLHGHERGNPGYRQDLNLADYRASPRPYQCCVLANQKLRILMRPSSVTNKLSGFRSRCVMLSLPNKLDQAICELEIC